MDHWQSDMGNGISQTDRQVSFYPTTGERKPILLPCHLKLLFCLVWPIGTYAMKYFLSKWGSFWRSKYWARERGMCLPPSGASLSWCMYFLCTTTYVYAKEPQTEPPFYKGISWSFSNLQVEVSVEDWISIRTSWNCIFYHLWSLPTQNPKAVQDSDCYYRYKKIMVLLQWNSCVLGYADMENSENTFTVPHRLIHLHAWSPFEEVFGRIRRCGLIEGSGLLGDGALWFQKLMPGPGSSLLPTVQDQDGELSATAPAPRLPTSHRYDHAAS